MEINHRIVNYSQSSTNPSMVAAEFIFSELGGGGRDSITSVVHDQTSGLEHLAVKLRPIKWTDEKHGLYLKSMEASFVDQLHDSIDILGWRSQKYPFDPSTQQHISKNNSFGQFKVFREGSRGKINFSSRDEAEMKKGDESGVEQITSNPWIRRYRSECRKNARTPASFEEYFAMADDFAASGFYVRHRVCNNRASIIGSSLEVTDQNFVDKDTKDEGECEMQSSKRIKTDAFSNDD